MLVAGDPEREHTKKVDKQGGLTYHINQILASEQMAANLGVNPMKRLLDSPQHKHPGKSHVDLHVPKELS